MRRERDREIERRRQRKAKVAKLKEKLAATKSASEREQLIAKIRKISPAAGENL